MRRPSVAEAKGAIVALLDGTDLCELHELLSGLVQAGANEIADIVREEFPDPNPLGSLFGGFVGEDIVQRIRDYGEREW
ncbi:hypothetical protein [Streptomyces sp. NBC_01198]|uniref:hypothetical protein n=1 Tax=Streptomyces sp. NBC_01198 TaxID=2903769 RepID=UPI002E0EE3D2|nr:hypothetical protein OG702_32230 [Streptomyces sp. NBC_01198]